MRSRTRIAAAGLAALALTLAGTVLVAAPASAADFTVTNNANSGAGSLRAAVEAANAAPGADVIGIGLPTEQTITLLSTITVTESVIIGNTGVAPRIEHAFNGELIVLDPTADGFTFSLNGPMTFDGTTYTGAALYSAQDEDITSVDVNDVSFLGLKGNSAVHLEVVTGAATFTRSTFDANSAGAGGGAIFFAAGSGDLNVFSSSFEDNAALGEGGAIRVVQAGDVLINDSSFVSNGAGDFGGAVAIGPAGDVFINGVTTFTNNEVLSGPGGALGLSGVGDVHIVDTQWIGNRSTVNDEGAIAEGGAIWAAGMGEFTVDVSLFSQNTAKVETDGDAVEARGGAIYLNNWSGPSSITESDFAGNQVLSPEGIATGGAIKFGNGAGDFVIKTSEFKGNILDGTNGLGGQEYGAAIAMSGELDFNIEIDASTFSNQVLSENSSGATSISVGIIAGSLVILNSTFNEPIVLDGLGAHPPMIFVDGFQNDGVLAVTHSTFIGDFAIRLDENTGGTWSITHSAFQTAPTAHPLNAEDNDIPTEYSAFSASDPGELADQGHNLIGVNLMLGAFGYNGGPTETAVPQAGSPLIDTGNPAVVNPPATDQRQTGYLRIVRIIDIGAVEVQVPLLPNTGWSVSPVIVIGGGMLLLAGLGAVLVARRRREV